jgi:hypothetical protein
VAELEKKRTALKARLEIPGVQSVRNKVLRKASTNVNMQGEEAELLEKLQGQIEKQQKLREANAINHAYRLAGRSTFAVGEEGLLGVCLETSTGGKFFESYYVILRLEPVVSVHKHTMPYFVPVDSIAKKHIENSVSDFLDELSEYVQVGIYMSLSLTRHCPLLTLCLLRDPPTGFCDAKRNAQRIPGGVPTGRHRHIGPV